MNGPLQDNVATIGDVPEPTYISDDPPLKFMIVAGVPSPVFDDEVSEEIMFEDDSTSRIAPHSTFFISFPPLNLIFTLDSLCPRNLQMKKMNLIKMMLFLLLQKNH